MKTMKRTLAAILAICMILVLTACGENPDPTTPPTNPATNDALTFVVADKTNWDKVITLGDYTYTLAVVLEDNGVLKLVGTCVDRAQAGGAAAGNNGSGGGETQETEPVETLAPMTDAEKAAQNFTKTGTWEYEAGYGYTLTIDGYKTKTNWNKASGRHYFYAEINHNGNSTGMIEFQGKDSGFRNKVAADYEDFEVRDAVITFSASGNTATGNASTTKLYLEKDNTANCVAQSGSSTTYTRGTWVENPDKSITLTMGGTVYSVDYCDVAGKEGYRVTYSSNTMYYTLSGAEVTYTDEDFNGKTIATLQCAEQDYTLVLTERGFAVLMQGTSSVISGKYVVNGDVYTVTMGGVDYVSEGNLVTVTYEKAGDSCNTTVITRTFALDGTVPEAAPVDPNATEPAQGGESEGGESEGGEGTQETQPAEGGESEGGESEGGESEGGEVPTEAPTEAPVEGGESEGGESEGGESEGGESEGGESEGGEGA